MTANTLIERDERIAFDRDAVPLGFEWGAPWELGSAAHWVWLASEATSTTVALGSNLREEAAACILCGYGVPSDVGVAAFERLRDAGMLERRIEADRIRAVLSDPLVVAGRPRPVRYRFAAQRSAVIVSAMTALGGMGVPDEPTALRDWLVTSINGVGSKTASFIVRNRFPEARVAVIDVHLRRAGVGAGFFDPSWDVSRSYSKFERAFLAVADAGGVAPAQLDHTIWSTLAHCSPSTRRLLCREVGTCDVR